MTTLSSQERASSLRFVLLLSVSLLTGCQEWDSLAESFWDAWGLMVTKLVFAGMVLALLWVFRFGRQLRRRVRSLLAVSGSLANGGSAAMSSDARGTFRETFRVHSDLESSWKEHEKLLLETPNGLRSMASAEASFNEDHLAGVAAPLQPIPTTLTALGMLGTFVGIAYGLGNLKGGPSMDIADVISGLSSAFWTSILGLVLAIGVNWYTTMYESRLRSAVRDLVGVLDATFPVLNQLNLLADSLSEQRATRNEAEEARSRLAEIAEALADRLGKQFDTAIQTRIGSHLERMTDVLQKQMHEVGSTAVEGSRAFIEEITQNLTGELSSALTGMAQTIDGFGKQFGDLAGGVTLAMGEIRSAVSAQQNIIERSAAVTQSASNETAVAQTAVQELHKTIQRMAPVLEQLGVLQGQAASASRSQAQSQESVATRTAEIARSMEAAQTAYTRTSSQLELLIPAMQQAVELLVPAAQGLARSSETASNRLDVATARMSERVTTETDLLKQYGSSVRQVEQALANSKDAMDGLRKAADAVTHQNSLATQTLQQTQSTLSAFEEAASKLREGGEQSAKGMVEASVRLDETVKATQLWVGDTTRAIEQFGEGLKHVLTVTLSVYDEKLSAGVKLLGASIRELSEAVDEIPSAKATHSVQAPRP
jgi:biopolymer transport protein ExbB/TolQ